ncbi:unnamed protein product [marine sediment metagenome]|uniref:HpcH/HpaI aldolase/citrate lyase domain-containing protein n=1 Tax=marine sediment metagenome TaxID=412755 RepID=X1BUZ2_9ZZZZ
MRSLLFVPAHREDLIEKALKSEADALIFDLEDSCPEKFHAKGIENIKKYPTVFPWQKKFVRVRNSNDWYLTDYCDSIINPKTENILIPDNSFALIESARGIMYSGTIAECCKGLIFGNEDYLADTGCSDYSFARGMVVNAAKAAGVLAIDSVFVDIKDNTGFEAECDKAYIFFSSQ